MRLVGTDFDIADWRHVAFFNAAESRIEMHLEALAETVVRWPEGERRFAPGERMHTENSYKWRPDDFAGLLRKRGIFAAAAVDRQAPLVRRVCGVFLTMRLQYRRLQRTAAEAVVNVVAFRR